MRFPVLESIGGIIINMTLSLHQDRGIWALSFITFYVCGVSWELRNWRIRQEFMNVTEEEG